MASWVSPPTHATGDVLAVTDWNTVANNEIFLYQAPYGYYYGSTSTTIPSGSLTQVTLNSIKAQGYGFSLSSNDAICPLTGVYLVSYGAILANTAGSGPTYFQAVIEQNGTQVLYPSVSSTANSVQSYPASAGSGLVFANASATLGLFAQQNSGSSIDISQSAAGTFLSVFFVGSQ